MAEGSNSSLSTKASGDDASSASEELVNINVKTLDSNVFSFRVDKKKPVSLLKETITGAVGVPPEQQRLIFKGKVLKDDQHLSVYHVEDGDTLHLVVRQPVQSQTQHATSSEDTRGNLPAGSLPRHRVGHSVVLGLNVGDQGENTSVDVSRIIGSVLNSLGIGTSGNPSSTSTPNIHAQASQNANGSSQTGSQSAQNPLIGMLPRQMVIPDSLTTLSAFMSCMEQLLSVHSGYQSSASAATQDPEQPALSRSFQYPSPDVLITVLQRAHQLLSGPAAASLSHLSGHLEREGGSTDLAIRGQVQAEAMHVGVTVQHLGSLLLELGRTISTLRMGESPSESMVNSGPAVYISASGPNPIMVQPVPNQTNPLFSIPFPAGINVGAPNLGLGVDTIRNINIHMQTAGSFANPRTNTRGANQEQPSNQRSTLPNQSSHSRSGQASGSGPQGNDQNVVPQHVSGLNLDNARQTTENNVHETRGVNDSDVGKEEPKNHPEVVQSCSTVNAGESSVRHAASSSSLLHDSSKSIADSVGALSSQSKESGRTPAPLGLGLGGLQPKRRNKHSQGKSSETNQDFTGCEEGKRLMTKGQEVLQSLMSSGPRSSQPVRSQSPNLGGMLSGMFQQMMPVVSQAFGAGSSNVSTSITGEAMSQRSQNGNDMLDGRNLQADLQSSVEGIERLDSPQIVFRNMLEVAAGQGHGGSLTDLLDYIGDDEELMNEFMEMMRRQLSNRLQTGSSQQDKQIKEGTPRSSVLPRRSSPRLPHTRKRSLNIISTRDPYNRFRQKIKVVGLSSIASRQTIMVMEIRQIRVGVMMISPFSHQSHWHKRTARRSIC